MKKNLTNSQHEQKITVATSHKINHIFKTKYVSLTMCVCTFLLAFCQWVIYSYWICLNIFIISYFTQLFTSLKLVQHPWIDVVTFKILNMKHGLCTFCPIYIDHALKIVFIYLVFFIHYPNVPCPVYYASSNFLFKDAAMIFLDQIYIKILLYRILFKIIVYS